MAKVNVREANKKVVEAMTPIYVAIESDVEKMLKDFSIDSTLAYFVEDRKMMFGDTFEFHDKKGNRFVLPDQYLKYPLNDYLENNMNMFKSHLDKEGNLNTEIVANKVKSELHGMLVNHMIDLIRSDESNLEKRIKFVIGKSPVFVREIDSKPFLVVIYSIGVMHNG